MAFASRVYVGAMAVSLAEYRPRAAEHGVLYRVIDEHLETTEHGVQRTQFEVLGADEARRVREALAALTPETAKGCPPGTLVLMRAGLLF